jgi:hypothetical protein
MGNEMASRDNKLNMQVSTFTTFNNGDWEKECENHFMAYGLRMSAHFY